MTSSYVRGRDSGYDPQAAGTAVAGGSVSGSTAGEQHDLRDHDLRDHDLREHDTREYQPRTDTGHRAEDRAGAGSDTRFDDADDTAAVEPRSTGHAAAGTIAGTVAGTAAGAGTTARATSADAADSRAEAVADETRSPGTGTGGERERLVPSGRAREYSSRWDALKGDFVDEPRRAVAQADDLVGELLDEIQRLFADQRRDLEQGLDHDQASTEDLRLALRRYRSFFDRLLSF